MKLIEKLTKPIYEYIDECICKEEKYLTREIHDLEEENFKFKEEIRFLLSKDEYRLVPNCNNLLFFARNKENELYCITISMDRRDLDRFKSYSNIQVECYEKNELIPDTYNLVISSMSRRGYEYYEYHALYLIKEDSECIDTPVKVWRASDPKIELI